VVGLGPKARALSADDLELHQVALLKKAKKEQLALSFKGFEHGLLLKSSENKGKPLSI
jgi:hypothetical protein